LLDDLNDVIKDIWPGCLEYHEANGDLNSPPVSNEPFDAELTTQSGTRQPSGFISALSDKIFQKIQNKYIIKNWTLNEKWSEYQLTHSRACDGIRSIIQRRLAVAGKDLNDEPFLGSYRGLSRWPMNRLDVGSKARYVSIHGEADVPHRISGMVPRRGELHPSADGSSMA
jgi:hypothetical protein